MTARASRRDQIFMLPALAPTVNEPSRPSRPAPASGARFCAVPGCAERTEGKFCERHRLELGREVEHGRADRAVRRLYRAHRWRALRASFLAIEPLCVQCARVGRVTAAEEVDHITPHRGDLTLFWNVDNLQSLCASCHSAKTYAESLGQFLRTPPVNISKHGV